MLGRGSPPIPSANPILPVNFTRLLAFLLLLAAGRSQELPIAGLAGVGLKVSNLDQAREYYTGWLGFEVAFTEKDAAGHVSELLFKVNDDQFLEVFPGLDPNDDVRRTHVSFLSADVAGLRQTLLTRQVSPGPLLKNRHGNLEFSHMAPEGTLLKFIQYLPNSPQALTRGKHLGSRRISTRLKHTGLIVADLQPSMTFYSEQLGFREFWRGGPTPAVTRWITFRVAEPAGDYVEFMLQPTPPTRRQRGAMDHISLEVADINAAYRELLARGMPNEKPRNPLLGLDRHWLLNVLDPDGTRTEFMESRTIPIDAEP